MPTDSISAFENFLSYGPIGLAGLMLVLVVVALYGADLTQTKASLLKFFMIIGAFCFAALVVVQFLSVDGEHNMTVSVLPSDINEKSHSSSPVLLVDGQGYTPGEPHVIKADFVFVIDMTSTVSKSEAALIALKSESEQTLEKLREDSEKELVELTNESNEALQELRDTIGAFSNELSRIKGVQEVVVSLQSESPSLEAFRQNQALNTELTRFISAVEPLIEAKQ